jgi:glycine dehydrogenase subunit 1
MGSYIPNTSADRAAMLKFIGKNSCGDLFEDVPESCLLRRELNLPSGLSEMAVAKKMAALAASNKVFPIIFRGAGAYKHYIPATVKRITAKEALVTAYTPYQPEISQGVLQSIFEYQTMICELTGMDASNASVYDGASAAAEAVNMCRDRGKTGVYVSATVHPQVIQTIKTYCWGYGIPVTVIPEGADGKTDTARLQAALAADPAAACFYMQSPNVYGLIEDTAACAELLHAAKALLVAGVNPLSLGLFESPGALGADIAVGEGQPLGLALGFGGPYLGFMAAKAALMRKLPGRIVGETRDSAGRRAFVLTLQAREQHIRREKASSNICSNEAHCALTAAVYLATLGEEGFQEAARQCHAKAVYAAKRIAEVPGYKRVHDGEFFHEFVTECPNAEKTLNALERRGILGGLPLDGKRLLWCVTECNSKEEIDLLARLLKEEGA